MSASQEPQDVRAAARAWLLRMELGLGSPQTLKEFQRWHDASEAHAAAYRDAQRVWTDASALHELSGLVELDKRGRLARRFRKTLHACRALVASGRSAAMRAFAATCAPLITAPRAFAFSAALLALFAAYFMLLAPGHVQHYATGIGEMRDIRLPDGSTVTLGARSAIDSSFDASKRQVTLRSGEAFFSVTHDAQRPFFVAVEKSLVRVVGTKFDLRRGEAEVQLGVLEGVVEISPKAIEGGSWSTPKVLRAGQHVSATMRGDLGDVRRTEAATAGAWRTGRRVYIDATLREIVADVNRYSRQPIQFSDPELEELRVSVSFRAQQLQQLFSSLAIALPIDVDTRAGDRVVLRSRNAKVSFEGTASSSDGR